MTVGFRREGSVGAPTHQYLTYPSSVILLSSKSSLTYPSRVSAFHIQVAEAAQSRATLARRNLPHLHRSGSPATADLSQFELVKSLTDQRFTLSNFI